MNADHIKRLEGDALTRICEEINTLPKQPDEFTIIDIVEQTGLERKTVEYRMNKLERDGVISSRRPAKERYYRFVDENNIDEENCPEEKRPSEP